jgi:uncharacterized membrane protein YfcA
MPDWAWTLLLVPAGFVAGVINTIAGGGSFLTLPALMYLSGLDPKIANGTNRVAILLSSASASVTFHKHGHIDRTLAVRVGIPTLLGVPVGALLAVYLPPDAFRPVFGAIFLAMAVLLVSRPRLLTDADRQPHESRAAETALFFGIGVYVGFIQAGFGILLLLGLGLFHARELVGANAVKNVLGFLVTALALSVFVIHGQVDWVPGLVMAAGNVAGGVVGAKLAIEKGRHLIFATLIVVMVATGVSLLWPRGEPRPDGSGSQAQGDTDTSSDGV